MHNHILKKDDFNQIPKLQAVDLWTGVCIFFVFFALLEYTAVNAAARTDAKVRKTLNLFKNSSKSS